MFCPWRRLGRKAQSGGVGTGAPAHSLANADLTAAGGAAGATAGATSASGRVGASADEPAHWSANTDLVGAGAGAGGGGSSPVGGLADMGITAGKSRLDRRLRARCNRRGLVLSPF